MRCFTKFNQQLSSKYTQVGYFTKNLRLSSSCKKFPDFSNEHIFFVLITAILELIKSTFNLRQCLIINYHNHCNPPPVTVEN